MTEPHSSRFEELLPVYVLGALDGAERAEMDAHVSGCAECRRQWAAWEEVLASVAEGVEPEPLSADLRQRVLATTERPLAAGHDAGRGTVSDPATARERDEHDQPASAVAPVVTSTATPTGATVTPMPTRRTPSWVPWAALAASLLALVVSWAGWMVRDLPGDDRQATFEQPGDEPGTGSADERLAAAIGELDRARAEIEILHQRIDRLGLAVQAIGSPRGQTYALASDDLPEAPPSAVGATFVDARLGRGTFHAFGLPEAPEGKTYQLWRITGGTPVSAGVFDVGSDGSGSLSLDELDPQEGDVWAVTVENAGGVEAPTMDAMVLKSS